MLQYSLPMVYCLRHQKLQNQGLFYWDSIHLQAFSLAVELEKSHMDLGQEDKEGAQTE